jgi:hypothetical protein
VVPARGPSSVLTTVPAGVVIGRDLALEEAVRDGLLRQVLRAGAELVHLRAADVLQQGDVLGRLAHGDVDVGQLAVLARVGPGAGLGGALRAAGLRVGERGLCSSWPGIRSLLPLTKRLTVSTPAEMTTSASPALMACSAIRVVCSDEEQ